jgi:hypothetical protein
MKMEMEWPEAVMIKWSDRLDMFTLGCVTLDVLCAQMKAHCENENAGTGRAVDHMKACLQSPEWRAIVQAWHLLHCAEVTKCSVVPPHPGALSHPSLRDGSTCAADLLFREFHDGHLLALAVVSWVRFALASPPAEGQTSPDDVLTVATATVNTDRR